MSQSPPDAVSPSFPIPTAENRWPRRAWYASAIVAFCAAMLWLSWTVLALDAEAIRFQVPVTTAWALHACTVLGIAALWVLRPRLRTVFGRKHWLRAGLLLALGYAACGLAPKINRIFYDEHIYMQIGQTFAHTGRLEYANYARVEYGQFEMNEAWVNKQPNGHPYLLGWWFRLWGASEAAAHQLVRLEVGLALALLFLGLSAVHLRMPDGAPLAAALALGLTPRVLWWGHTVAVEPATVFSTVAAIAAACLHAALRDRRTGAGSPAGATLLAAASAAAVYFRPESLLVFPVVALLLYAADRRFLRDRATWAALGLAIALAMPQLLQHWSVRTEDWGAADGRRFDTGYLAKNLASNLGYFVAGRWFPLAGTVLALCGAGWLARRNPRLGLAAGVWWLIAWGIFVLFYAGGYHYGASSRYAVVSAAPVALFAGIGATALWSWLRRRPALAGVAAAAVLLNWLSAMGYVPTLERESCEARADIDWIREAARELPRSSLVVCSSTGVWAMLGCNAAQPGPVDRMIREEMPELARQYPGGIYLHWDYWANAQKDIAETMSDLVRCTDGKPVREGRFENYRFVLYRLDHGPVPPMPNGLPLPDEATKPAPAAKPASEAP